MWYSSGALKSSFCVICGGACVKCVVVTIDFIINSRNIAMVKSWDRTVLVVLCSCPYYRIRKRCYDETHSGLCDKQAQKDPCFGRSEINTGIARTAVSLCEIWALSLHLKNLLCVIGLAVDSSVPDKAGRLSVELQLTDAASQTSSVPTPARHFQEEFVADWFAAGRTDPVFRLKQWKYVSFADTKLN